MCKTQLGEHATPLVWETEKVYREDDISADLEEMRGSVPGTEKSKWHPGRLIAYKSVFMRKRVAHMESVAVAVGRASSELRGEGRRGFGSHWREVSRGKCHIFNIQEQTQSQMSPMGRQSDPLDVFPLFFGFKVNLRNLSCPALPLRSGFPVSSGGSGSAHAAPLLPPRFADESSDLSEKLVPQI